MYGLIQVSDFSATDFERYKSLSLAQKRGLVHLGMYQNEKGGKTRISQRTWDQLVAKRCSVPKPIPGWTYKSLDLGIPASALCERGVCRLVGVCALRFAQHCLAKFGPHTKLSGWYGSYPTCTAHAYSQQCGYERCISLWASTGQRQWITQSWQSKLVV